MADKLKPFVISGFQRSYKLRVNFLIYFVTYITDVKLYHEDIAGSIWVVVSLKIYNTHKLTLTP